MRFPSALWIVLSLALPFWVSAQEGEWPTYSGNLAGQKYSPLDQIDSENVRNLRIAWRQSATPPEIRDDGSPERVGGNYQHTPLMVGGLLYMRTESGVVAALEPTNGEVVWFDREARAFPTQSRGIAYWTDGTDERIIALDGSFLIALNAKTGARYRDFGEGGQVDLTVYDERPNSPVGGFSWSSPPLVVGDVIVIGGVPALAQRDVPSGERPALGAPGDIRGYDVHTGEQIWTFHVIPRPGEFGYETWLDNSADINGGAGTWTWMSGDEELGYVFIATEAASNDMYGGFRPGDDLFSNSVLCLDARTGERVWHFQTIHHDIWDFDNPTAPILVDINVDGRDIKAVVQLTKQAFAYVLDRETGEPVWPIEERPVPSGDTPGEWYSPTQPFPTKPPAYEQQNLGVDDLINFTPELRRQALELLEQYEYGPLYLPPSPNHDIVMVPGTVGGSGWHGAGFDPETGMLYIPVVRMPVFTGLARPPNPRSPFPFTRRGLGSLLNSNFELPIGEGLAVREIPPPLPWNLPALKPPYGSIVGMDLNEGEIPWTVPNGDGPRDHPYLRDLDLPPLGTPNRASPLVTKTLLFVGEGQRGPSGPPRIPVWGGGKMFRALDKATGDVVWEIELPGGTSGGPITYLADGRQYIVVAVGWEDMSAELIALALP